MSRVCAITGATGYVGSRVAASLAAQGWTVRTLGRHGADFHFDLAGSGPVAGLGGAQALVHLSYDFAPYRWEEVREVNVHGSRRLLTAAKEHGIERIVFISSLAAFTQARSLYGRAKVEIERAALDQGATVIRPGLVWGTEPGAMFASLDRIVARLPIVPLLAPFDLPMLMVNEEDVGYLVRAALEHPERLRGRLVVAGAAKPVTFGELLLSIGAAHGRRPKFVQIPWRAVWAGLRLLELAHLDPPFRSDSLISLVAVNRHPFAEQTADASKLGVSFRPYPL